MMLAVFVAATVCFGVVRTLVQHAGAAVARSRGWRLAVLLALQPVCGGLLYLTLAPPPSSSPAGTLVIATRNTPVVNALAREDVIALPEAPAIPGAERVPDLATALRRHPAARLRIIGEGLEPRDQDSAKGLPLDLDLTPIPPGLTRLNAPRTVAPGAAFRVGGQVNTLKSNIELIDPANRRVDNAVPDAAGNFVVEATSRVPGPAIFTLRILDGAKVVEAAIPILTIAAPPQRILLLPGAPGPEIKYLRRWASDAGLAVQNQYAVGGGLEIGDTPLPLTAATLTRFDVAVLDDRSWTALSPGERKVFVDAVRNGLGLIVRITGPLTDTAAAALRPLGFAVSGGADALAVTLPSPADDAAAQQARIGPGTGDDPAQLNRGDAEPALSRWSARIDAPAATPLLRDAHSATVAIWRTEGQGRIAIWPLADSFRLVLAGHGDRYGELWSTTFATLGRGQPGGAAELASDARVDQRASLCRIGSDAVVVSPDGVTTKLIADPAAGGLSCAAYWPRVAGWHKLTQRYQQNKETSQTFYVAPGDATPGVRAAATHDATLQLAQQSSASTHAAAIGSTHPGPSWPWFLSWLGASALLWWIERSKFGRVADA